MGFLYQAQGEQQAAAAQAAEATYQSQVQSNNAQIEQQNANLATATGEAQAARQGLVNRAQSGQIKAAQGANNIDVNSGSAKQVQESQKELGLFDVNAIRARAAQEAYGFETQATSASAQSQLLASEAPLDIQAGKTAAAGTLVGGLMQTGFQAAQLAMLA